MISDEQFIEIVRKHRPSAHPKAILQTIRMRKTNPISHANYLINLFISNRNKYPTAHSTHREQWNDDTFQWSNILHDFKCIMLEEAIEVVGKD